MFRSIRGRLQLWHALVLMLVLASFGGLLYGQIRHAKFKEIDSELEGSAMALYGQLRYWPPPWFRPGEHRPGRDDRDGRGNPAEPAAKLPPPELPKASSDKEKASPNKEASNKDAAKPERKNNKRPSERSEAKKTADGKQAQSAAGQKKSGEEPDPRNRPGGRGPRGFPSWPDIELPGRYLQRFGDDPALQPYFAIYHGNGEIFKQARTPDDLPAPDFEPWDGEGPQPPEFRQRGNLREVVQPGFFGIKVIVGRSIEPELAQLRHLAMLLAATGAGVLVVGLVGGWIISNRAVRPISQMSATAEAISVQNLSQRINVTETDSELGRLASVLNQMFDRLEAAFQRQVRFTADASHELRTPVAIILADAELTLTRERSPQDYRETIETCHRAARRMKSLVDALLTLARMDSGEFELHHQPFDLGQVAGECVDLLRPLACQRRLKLEFDAAPAEMNGDPERIAQVVMNLVTNAVNYNRDDGEVRVNVARENGEVVLSVADTGIGIPLEDQAHIFERFYRVDKARSRELGGSGLGLAICRSIVQAHRGTISFTSEPDQGTTFVARFPAVE